QLDGQLRPLVEQGADLVGRRVHAGVGPQHGRVGHVLEEIRDRARVGMRLEEELLALREREERAHRGETELTRKKVELAEPAVHTGAVDRFDVRNDRRIARPREHVGDVPVWTEHRDDPLARTARSLNVPSSGALDTRPERTPTESRIFATVSGG